MPFDVTLPNGRVIKGVPDGTTKEQVQQKAIASGYATIEDFGTPQATERPRFVPEPWKRNEQPDAGINPIRGNLEALLSGASFGLSDEIQGGIAALTQSMPRSQVTGERPSALDLYKMTRDKSRQDAAQFREQEGAAAYVPEVIGGLTTGLGGLSKSAGMGSAALIGGAEGGLAGAGYADAENFISPETAQSAGYGAAGGTVAGPVLRATGQLVKKGGGAIADRFKRNYPNVSGKATQIAREELTAGSKPDDAARYVLKKTQDPKKPYVASNDTLAIKAMDSLEIPPNVVNSIKELSPADKKDALKMLRVIKIGRKNTAFAEKNRPGDILGETLKKDIDLISVKNTKARKQLDAYVKSDLTGKPVDVNKALQDFAGQLDELGVQINKTKTGKLVPDFDGALKLNRNDRTPIREAIRKVNKVLEKGQPTADAIHDLKRALDNEIPWDAASKMTTEGEGLLKGLRHNLNESLRNSFDRYAEINKVLEDTTGALKGIAKSAGRKYDPESENAGKFLGQELRKLATNYNSRIPIVDSLDEIERVARKYGKKSGTDVSRQATMVNDLEDLLGESASRGYRGETRKATRDAIKDVAGGHTVGPAHRFIDWAHENIAGVTPEAQIEILEQLLTRN